MSDGTYLAYWPILDINQRRSEMIRQAIRDLPAMLDAAGCIPTGDPSWHTSDCHLTCSLPVRAITAPRSAP